MMIGSLKKIPKNINYKKVIELIVIGNAEEIQILYID